MVWSFFLVAYLIVLFQVVIDVFRNDDLSGWGKAVWVLALLLVPALTALIYLVINGSGMAARQRGGRGPVPEPGGPLIINAPTPVDQIAQAKALLDSGAITADEFAALKAKALG